MSTAVSPPPSLWYKSYHDTRMFIVGLLAGVAIQMSIARIRSKLDVEDDRHWTLLAMGVAQVFLNALLINVVSMHCQSLGLFMLGLLSPQFLLVRHAVNRVVV